MSNYRLNRSDFVTMLAGFWTLLFGIIQAGANFDCGPYKAHAVGCVLVVCGFAALVAPILREGLSE